jgi:hypothetical protein
MKTPRFQFLALVGMAVAATASIENTRHLRRALEESDAARSATKDGPTTEEDPPGGRYLGRLRYKKPPRIQSQEENDDDMETTEDDPPGRRDLGRLCRKPATMRPKKPGRRDLGRLGRGRKPATPAIQSKEEEEEDDDLEPTEEMIELVGDLDDNEDSETAEEDPPGNGRDLFGRLPRCKSRCVRNGCRRNGRRFDCCQAYSGGYVAC